MASCHIIDAATVIDLSATEVVNVEEKCYLEQEERSESEWCIQALFN